MVVSKIDQQGFYIESVVIESEEIPDNHIAVPVPGGLYRPKWNGAEWVEGMNAIEIQTLKDSAVYEESPLEIENKQLKKQLTDLSFELMMKGVL